MADDSLRHRRWAVRNDPRTAVGTAAVWEVLDDLLAARATASGRKVLEVIDLGGGTGGFAVPVAGLGHRVTVVDPSPDALAALQRRAAEAGVADSIRAEQGDSATLGEIVPAGSADLVLCHGLLEYVDDPAAAVRAALAALRPGGALSVLAAQRLGAVVAKALAGRFREAQQILESPDGRFEQGDPLPRRFDQRSLVGLLAAEGARVHVVHGVRLFTDLLPGSLVDGEPDTAEELLALERAGGDHPRHRELVALAAQVHVIATVPSSGTEE